MTADAYDQSGIAITGAGVGSADYEVSNSIIRGNGIGTEDYRIGLNLWSTGSGVWKIWNNVVYDWDGTGTYVSGIAPDDAGFTYYIYNNTVVDCSTGIINIVGTVVAKNNLVYSNNNNYSGSFDGSSTNNLSGPTQTDAPGSNPRNAATVTFVNPGADDFHLDASDIGATDYGADLDSDPNLPITDDIEGDARDVSNPDIGADEYISLLEVDSVSSSRSGANNLTISHTTSGTDRLMLVGVSFNNDAYETVSSVTYNGAALSLVDSVAEADDARVEIWSLVAPDTGTHDVVITFSAQLTRSAVAGVTTFTGVHQTTPLGTFASANAPNPSPGPATVNVSSATNELVFDTVACETCTSLTVGGGQTQRWNLSEEMSSAMGAGSTEPGAATVTMSWALGSGDHWAIGAVPIKPSGGSPPAVDAVSTDTTGVDSFTISHTTTGTYRLMLVGISHNPNNNEIVSSVTYNGTALTLVGTATWSNDARAEIWQLVAPDTGTHDVVITFSENMSAGAVAGVMTFTEVNQTTPLGTFASANGLSAGPATVNVSSATNELVFDTVACETCTSLTVGGGQTEYWNLSQNDTHVMGAGSTEPGAATVTMSWTLGSSDYWAIGAVPIKPR